MENVQNIGCDAFYTVYKDYQVKISFDENGNVLSVNANRDGSPQIHLVAIGDDLDRKSALCAIKKEIDRKLGVL